MKGNKETITVSFIGIDLLHPILVDFIKQKGHFYILVQKIGIWVLPIKANSN